MSNCVLRSCSSTKSIWSMRTAYWSNANPQDQSYETYTELRHPSLRYWGDAFQSRVSSEVEPGSHRGACSRDRLPSVTGGRSNDPASSRGFRNPLTLRYGHLHEGILAMADDRFVVQGVHMMIEGRQRSWKNDAPNPGLSSAGTTSRMLKNDLSLPSLTRELPSRGVHDVLVRKTLGRPEYR